MDFSELKETYLIELETENEIDIMTIQVEADEADMKGGKSEDLRKRIVDALQAELQVKPAVQILPKGTIPVTEGDKAKRVHDKRSL